MLRQLTDGLWVANKPFRFKPTTLNIGVRMTIIRLADSSLWVHSPIELDDELVRSVDELGRVSHIIAPSKVHHLFCGAAKEVWPDALLSAAPGLRYKGVPLPDPHWLDAGAPEGWDEFEFHEIEGNRAWDEVAFLHKPSRTLLLTDHLFNLHEVGILYKIPLKLLGGHRKPAWPRAGRFTLWKGDDAKLKASIEAILAWDFDRITLAHGEVVESGGRQALERAYSWLL